MPMQERKTASSPKKVESWATRRWFVIERATCSSSVVTRVMGRFRSIEWMVCWTAAATGREVASVADFEVAEAPWMLSVRDVIEIYGFFRQDHQT